VQYELAGPFQTMLHCHCSMCRKHHGASFATFVAAPHGGFRWLSGKEAVASYRSSEQSERFYCRGCGSVAPTLLPEAELAIAPARNLEGDLRIRPQMHAFVGSKAPFYVDEALIAARERMDEERVPLPIGGIDVGAVLHEPNDVVHTIFRRRHEQRRRHRVKAAATFP
jgi:hypothetical protein